MNNIELSKNYIPLLDELYRKEETSSVLNSSPKDIKMGAKAGEFLVAKYTIDGPADYSRNGGYQDGDVSVEWETHKANMIEDVNLVLTQWTMKKVLKLHSVN